MSAGRIWAGIANTFAEIPSNGPFEEHHNGVEAQDRSEGNYYPTTNQVVRPGFVDPLRGCG